MSDNYDAREFQTSTFLKKDELKQSGPQRLTITTVVSADGISREGKPPKQVLQLTFTDDRKFGLGTMVNLQRVIALHGPHTSAWIGKTIELYYSPDVRGPNGEEGGIRVRQATGPAVVVTTPDFVTELEDVPAKPNGSGKPGKPGKRSTAKRSVADEETAF